MKTLSNYVQAGITESLEKFGAFFAFSTEQFNESKKENTKYVNLGSGLICPKENAKLLIDALNENSKQGIKKDIEENGIDNIIKRELYNHEAFYTNELEDTFDALKPYNITLEQIKKVYYKELPNIEY